MNAYQLASATGARIDRATTFLPYILAAMDEYSINTPERQAAFLSQIGHESGGFYWLVELWGAAPTAAQRTYGNRMGNQGPEDGYKYRGRGLIQITGHDNYRDCGEAFGLDLLATPELLGKPELASRSAAWFWSTHGCNELADAGSFETITRRINGGLNGYPERMALWAKAKDALAA